MLTQLQLKSLLHYNPETGVFTWVSRRNGSTVRVGDIAGTIDVKGYRRIGIKIDRRGEYYRAHRLAWFYMTGRWPAAQVDHIDGDRDNNRWLNLRLATNGQNRANSRKTRGYTFHKPTRKWVAQIQKDKKNHRLGYFATEREAKAAYDAAAKQLFGEFARP